MLKKIVWSMVVCGVVFSSNACAEDIIGAGSDIVKEAIKAYADVEKTRINAGRSEVDMTDVGMKAKVKNKRAININTNNANQVRADKVKMVHVRMEADTENEETLNYESNNGNQIGK